MSHSRTALPHRRLLRLLIFLLCTSGFWNGSNRAAGDADSYYVAGNGNDSWSGRLAAPNEGRTDGPFATLRRARDALRLHRGTQRSRPSQVVLRAGKYFLREPLVLDERDSGTKAAPVTWTAYRGEKPIVSGGVPLDHWHTYRDAILETRLDQGNAAPARPVDLFCNGVRQVRARSPNRDAAHPLYRGWAFMQGPAGADAFQYRQDFLLKPLSKPSQAEVTFFVGPAGGWGSQSVAITAIDFQRRIIHTSYADGENPLLGFNSNCRFIIENALEALDQPGEWCADGEKRTVYFWPPRPLGPGSASAATGVVIPVVPTLLALSHARWITVRGLTFLETAAGDAEVRCDECAHVCLIENRLLGAGGRALVLGGDKDPCSDVLVQRNEIAEAAGSGIYVRGSARDCRILDNEVHHCGVHDKYSAGIEFPFYGGTAAEIGPCAFSDRVVIAHNFIHDLPRDGVQLGANPYGRNVVEYNRVERTSLETIDAGALRCHRIISHLQGIKHLPSMAGHIFRYNLVSDTMGCGVENGAIVTPYPWPTFGIYLDEGSSHCTVRGNVVVRSGVGAIINPGEENTIENNVFADNPIGICFQAPAPLDAIQPPLGQNRLRQNIVLLPTTDSFAYRLQNWTPGTLAESDFNVFWNRNGNVLFETRSDDKSPFRKWTFADWQKAGHDLHSMTADPQFRSSNHYGDLLPASPAKRMGFVPISLDSVGMRSRAEDAPTGLRR